jgi:DNA processing protein
MIREKGLLISENPPDFSGSAIALLRRNRIISAISDAMIVVTSSDGSGTMTQMDHAYDQKIPILCPPEKLNFTPHEGITKKRLAYNINEVENVEQIFEIINKKKASFLSYQQKL